MITTSLTANILGGFYSPRHRRRQQKGGMNCEKNKSNNIGNRVRVDRIRIRRDKTVPIGLADCMEGSWEFDILVKLQVLV
jgi:hypothetical protein